MYRADKNLKDIEYILDNVRKEDLIELQTIWGEEWREKTIENIINTDFNILLGKTKNKDIPVVMGGFWQVPTDEKGVGCAWMLSTDEIKNHSICLLRELKKELNKADETFWMTYNFIYKENFLAKKWLKWLGYKFDIPKPEGVEVPENFEFFYRIRPVKGLGE